MVKAEELFRYVFIRAISNQKGENAKAGDAHCRQLQ